ncbi:MAG: hypothetical protein EOP35_15335 [Rubrivivax sp.]|nr:MAG: hypothetical protein EOP35_15335 [Rubrivivax sp.]
MRYSMLLIAAEPEPGQLSEEILAAGQAAFRKYANDLHAAGVLVAGDIDLDAALAWAEACPGAHYGSVEVRPCALTVRDGQWVPPK